MDPNESIKVAVLEEQMKTLTKSVESLGAKMENKIDTLTDKIDDNYVKTVDFDKFRNDEFAPVKNNYDKLIWWIIGTLLAALGGLVLATVNYVSSHH